MRKLSSNLYLPFTYKMMTPYLILVLLTDVLNGYISYTMLVQSRTEMAETNIRTAMEQTRNNIKYQMDEIKRMSDTLFTSISFQNALQKKGEPLDVMLKMRDEVPRLSGKKVVRIVRMVRSFQDGDFHKRMEFSGNDEFVHIANSFNVMATSIQELINNVYVQGIEKKPAESG